MSSIASETHLFSVEGIHCSQCLKKLKGLKNQVRGLEEVSIDMSHQTLKARTGSGFRSQNLIKETEKLGFQAREVFVDELQKKNRRRKKNALLSRVGVAGALAGNIMLLSYAVYLGAPAEFATVFNSVSGMLFLPILFYSAVPLFQNSWQALKVRRPSIDLPLAFAVLSGSFLSYFQLFSGSEAIYFDSLAALVFLIMASRYISHRFQLKYLSPVSVKDLLPTTILWRKEGAERGRIRSENVSPGDEIILRSGQAVPADSVVLSEKMMVDNSLMTGEADPVGFEKWSKVYAGARCLSDEAHVKIEKEPSQSRVSRIIDLLNESLEKESSLVRLTDSFAYYFTTIVFAVGLAFFIGYSLIDLGAALERVLALFVIACPCALAVTTPIVLKVSAKRAMRKNFLVKQLEVFESLDKCNAIVFDKTGTLTFSSDERDLWTPRAPNERESQIIFALEKRSEHPVAQSILRSLKSLSEKEVNLTSFEERVGWGVTGRVDGEEHSLCRMRDELGGVGFYRNSELVLRFQFKSQLRPEVVNELQQLRQMGFEVFLLTGDHQKNACHVAEEAGIDADHVYFQVSPEEKNKFIEELSQSQKVVYVGDGLNDSLAMSSGVVGISMHKSVEATFQASHLHLLSDGLCGLSEFVRSSRLITRSVKTIIFTSLIYNLLFGTLALTGAVTPLVASVLMPLSSLSLLGLGLFFSRRALA